MAGWSEYQAKGIWGLWVAAYPSGVDLGLAYDSFSFFFSSDGLVRAVESLPPGSVFEWESAGGFRLHLYADAIPAAADAGLWQILLEHEVVRSDGYPTFLPFFPGLTGLALQLNEIVAQPPALLVLNGQPGAGKEAVLQTLAIRHANTRIDNRDEVVIHVQTRFGLAFVVPEIALLEVAEQQAVVKHIKGWGVLWAADSL